MTIINFFEMPEDDAPPQEMWGNDEQLEQWFKDVKVRRENPQKMETIPNMNDNELTTELGL